MRRAGTLRTSKEHPRNMLGTCLVLLHCSSGAGWGKAKSVVLIYLQGGPSHLDLWGPKEDLPDNMRSQRVRPKLPLGPAPD